MTATDLGALVGLPRRFILEGLLSETEAIQAIKAAKTKNRSFVHHLIVEKILTSIQVAEISAIDFGLPLLDLSVFDYSLAPIGLVSEKLIIKHHAVPLIKRADRLYVAISDPTNVIALSDFKFHTGLNTYGILVEDDKLVHIIEHVLSQETEAVLGDLNDADLDDIDLSSEIEEEEVSISETEDAPIVRFVNKILLDAIKKGVSDIHFEPYEKVYRIRFRRDGILYETANPPINLANRITARIKVISRMDISERRVPQDGHFNMALSKSNTINFRVNTCPTTAGEKVVIRILDPSKLQLGIEDLGYEENQKKAFVSTIHKPQGMVLVTGPTGSGKTVSLYTALHMLNTPEKNISTIEDPVEINIQGINQVHVNNKAGLNFASALRAFLRQDPDIIMVGEIRDLETAEIAIKAAQTGHLVLSTLHTNNAPETLTRLVNMGVAPFNIATSVNLIIAQRLARRLCKHCKEEESIPKEALLEEGLLENEITDLKIFAPNIKGCEHCKAGYSGRIGIYEVLKVTHSIGEIIMRGGNSIDVQHQAIKEGLQTLRRSALKKVMEGITSLEEVNRVTKD
ncbi:MAG: type IV-A pilus assembly ATPase PilB [Legionellales bacterium]|nr:type IV-A pilus assembly ATPase PilB [Legionellales bacterium]